MKHHYKLKCIVCFSFIRHWVLFKRWYRSNKTCEWPDANIWYALWKYNTYSSYYTSFSHHHSYSLFVNQLLVENIMPRKQRNYLW